MQLIQFIDVQFEKPEYISSIHVGVSSDLKSIEDPCHFGPSCSYRLLYNIVGASPEVDHEDDQQTGAPLL